jgi:protein ImuB
MLWLCLHFPFLPLEIFSRAERVPCPRIVGHGKGPHQHVLVCNAEARALGIRPGMPVSAAYGLTNGLRVHARDETAECRALEALAAWANQFTSFVSLRPPQALLLEIEGSLNLFAGMDTLLRRVHREAARLGYDTELGVAPTPRGAWLLARAGIAQPAVRIDDLIHTLRNLPLTVLELDDKTFDSLSGMGLRCIGDVLRLSRAGLNRRLGPAFLDNLDRLLGHRADAQEPYHPPPTFERHLTLPAETSDREALLFPAHRLLLELGGFLNARGAGTQRLSWTLAHHRQAATPLTLSLSAPSRDPAHLLDLLRERLERIDLAHAVEGVTLQVTDIRPLGPCVLRLDGESESAAEEWPRLVERLRARLGDAVVQGLQCRADHRPERAWAPCTPSDSGPALRYPERPLWLLPEPRLITRNNAPWLDERLRLLEGPERIESGWWDGGDVRRDYFVACDSAHAHYWIFRERDGERRWFLHGLFA